ncbi:MAG: DUF1622 domain-containing protein [Actinomycetota bacterium]|nr:DUF1622 domain-containing protein [Actinomycetota bacterium]
MTFSEAIEAVGKVIDGVGVATILIGSIIATTVFLLRTLRQSKGLDAYRLYRQGLGRAILLGLEFLVGADIIRTVAIDPTFRSAGVLAVIVAIRTFLSISLELEISGRWPWQRHGNEGSAA